MGLDVATIVSEFYRGAQREGMRPEDLLPRKLFQYEVELTAVLDLREDEAREVLDLTEDEFRGDDLSPCQAIGEAAHYIGLEGVLAPSAVGPGDVLAVFYSRLKAGSSVRDVSYETWTSLPPRPSHTAR